MNIAPSNLEIREYSSTSELDATHWNACIPETAPFARHEFLQSLEKSSSIGSHRGFLLRILTLWSSENLVSLCPYYLKWHSFGEYVFDWQWAQTLVQQGLPYYPKMVLQTPYMPVRQPKLFVHHKVTNHIDVKKILLNSLIERYRQMKLSSFQVLYPCPSESALFAEHLLERKNLEFYWDNPPFTDHAQFLQLLKARKRKQWRKERKAIANSDLSIYWKKGADIDARELRLIQQCYRKTLEKRGGQQYLEESFFEYLIREMPDHIRVCFAKRGDTKGELVAMAFYIESSKALYGRYWGCLQEVPYLHFELCLHRPMEKFFDEKKTIFEAGAQGTHKWQRGLIPTLVSHYYDFSPDALKNALGELFQEERQYLNEELMAMQSQSPFSSDSDALN